LVVLGVAAINGHELNLNEAFSAGAAFHLAGPIGKKKFSRRAANLTIEIDGDAEYLFVHTNGHDPDQIIRGAYEAAQTELDILAMAEALPIEIPHASLEYIVWWMQGDSRVLRAVTSEPIGATGTASLTVVGPDGIEKPMPPIPEPTWFPALRYFRFSQLASDVFESYRNMFLSLESVLSRNAPKGTGSEKQWLLDCLNSLDGSGGFNLRAHLPTQRPDALERFVDDQYDAHRCAMFHAKEQRSPLLPGSYADRQLVEDALRDLSRVLLGVIRCTAGITYPSGGLTVGGLELMMEGIKDWTLATARDESPLRSEQRLSDVPDPVIKLDTEYIGKVSVDGRRHGYLGTAQGLEFEGSGFNSLIMIHENELMARNQLPLIEPGGIGRFEALLVHYLRNPQTPLSDFPR
jgi:hypothetical protein